MDEKDTWYLVHSVLKHHDIVKEGEYEEVREELIRLQQSDPQRASQLYMTQHIPEDDEPEDFMPLTF